MYIWNKNCFDDVLDTSGSEKPGERGEVSKKRSKVPKNEVRSWKTGDGGGKSARKNSERFSPAG